MPIIRQAALPPRRRRPAAAGDTVPPGARLRLPLLPLLSLLLRVSGLLPLRLSVGQRRDRRPLPPMMDGTPGGDAGPRRYLSAAQARWMRVQASRSASVEVA